MQGKLSTDEETHLIDLATFVKFYNWERFPFRLFDFAPMEVVNGKEISKYLFTDKIAQAQLARREVNRSFKNCIAFLGCSTPKL